MLFSVQSLQSFFFLFILFYVDLFIYLFLLFIHLFIYFFFFFLQSYLFKDKSDPIASSLILMEATSRMKNVKERDSSILNQPYPHPAIC